MRIKQRDLGVKLALSIIMLAFSICLLIPSSWARNLTDGRININTADQKQLEYLPGVGPVTAAKIIKSRRNQGRFVDISELLERKIVWRSTYDKLKTFVQISGKSWYVFADKKKHGGGGEGGSTTDWEAQKHVGDVYLLKNSAFSAALLEKIKRAKKGILISTFVFKTTKSPRNKANLLIKQLSNAVKRGVQVEVLLEHNPRNKSLEEGNRMTAEKLGRNGITVHWDDPKQTLHAKLAVIDDTWVIVGSHNLTHSAMEYNNETSLLVKSGTMARELKKYYRDIIKSTD